MALATRRALFALAPVLAILGAPAAAATANPDAELITLCAQWEVAAAAEAAADDALEGAVRRVWDSVEVPPALYPPKSGMPDFVAGLPMLRKGEHYFPSHRERVLQHYESNRRTYEDAGCNRQCMERCKEVLDALDVYQRRMDEARAREGVERLDAESLRAYQAVAAIEEKILAIRARTIEGLKVKAKVAARHRSPEDPTTVSATFERSLFADLEAA